MVLTPDTLTVVRVYKALRNIYDTGGDKKLQKGELPVRIWKLFARHMPI